MERITVDGKEFEAHRIATAKASILLIKAKNGFVGCGYFDIETADKLNEQVAIVTGVKCFDDVLKAEVIKYSKAAAAAGVEKGMSGKEALMIFNAS
jgi:uncharacterized protein YunC (DUF1805 family)